MSFSTFIFTATKRPCRVLRDPGPSSLHMQTPSVTFLHSRLRHHNTSAPLRSFYTSPKVKQPRPTTSWQQPRWINTRRNGQKNEDGEEQSDENEPDDAVEKKDDNHTRDSVVQLEGSEDGAGHGAPASSSSHPPPAGANSGGSTPPSGQLPPSPPGSNQTSISKQSVPEHYPQVLALPIARRPLFPGFYKAVVIRNPGVVAAVKEMMKRGQPYLGAFLLKDENTDSDVITDLDSVHHVGVFAQITSVFAASGKDDKEEGLTAVLYPHRRIKITGLVKNGKATVEQVPTEEPGLPTPPPSPTPEQKSEEVETSEVSPPSTGNNKCSVSNVALLTFTIL